MNKYKVCVYAICKNEEAYVDKWVDSMSEADEIIVCDTGSSDNTVKVLERLGVKVYKAFVSPWRFDVARNIALSFIPADTDICVSTDLDEAFKPGWREKLEEAWNDNTTRLRYLYSWGVNSDGTRKNPYWYNKIHHRLNYKWVNPVHETIKYYGNGEEVFAQTEEILLNHYPDTSKPRGQYLTLLELSRNENPDDSQTAFWLGREYYFYKQYDHCIDVLIEHLEMNTATWKEERCASMRFIAKSYKTKGNLEIAKAWAYKAIAECQYIREPYVDMMQLSYENKQWELVYAMYVAASRIRKRQTSYLSNENCWNSTIYDLASVACYEMEHYEEAKKLALKANKKG